MIHFSTLKGKEILDLNGRVVGPLVDLTITPEGKFAKVTSYVTKINGERRKIPSKNVVKYDKQIHLNAPFAKIPILKEEENEFSLVTHVLDMQIVDTEGLKVVRVNDVLLSVKDGILSVTSVDVGFKGFLRRLGLERFNLVKKMKEQIIPWEFVAPLELHMKKIQLNIPKDKLSKLHPADLADIMEDLSHQERAMIFKNLDEEVAAKTLKESTIKVQKSIFKNLKPEKIIEILEELRPEEAADLLFEMPEHEAEEILTRLKPEMVLEIKEIMKYGKESAGGLMSTSYLSVSSKSTAEDVINYLRELAPDAQNIYYIYVLGEENILLGILSLRNLIVAKPKELVENIMNKRVTSVNLSAKKEDIANMVSKYNLLSIPVINDKGHLEGVIRSDTILDHSIPKRWKGRVHHPHHNHQNDKRNMNR